MNFNMIIEEPNLKCDQHTIERVGVRAIIIESNHILLVQSKRGDFKFPEAG